MSGIADFLGLPARDRVLLAHSPLVLAACEVRFGAILSVADGSYVAPFQRAIIDAFPVALAGQQMEVSFSVGVGQIPAQGHGFPRQWLFSDAEGVWRTTLTEEHLVLETRRYASFDDFLSRLKLVVTALEEHIRPTVVTRIGLRYINEIREPGAVWGELVNPLVLGVGGAPEFAGRAANFEFLNQYQFAYPHEQGCNIRCGLLPRGSVITNPLPDTDLGTPFFVLDIDVFREYRASGYRSMDAASICEQIGDYHGAIYSIFRWALTDKYITATRTGEE